jgi:hypothetical protein
MGPQLKVNSGDTMNGFKMTFENGWTVSVQFGKGTYSEHRSEFKREQPEFSEVHVGKLYREVSCDSTSAEVWAIHEDYEECMGSGYDPHYKATHYPDDPRGWQTPDEVAKFIQEVKDLSSKPWINKLAADAKKAKGSLLIKEEENDE